MRINLDELNPGVFFTWPGEPEDSKKGITVRPLSGSAIKLINKQTLISSKIKFTKKGQQYTDEIYNEAKKEELIADYCIVDWKGLEGEDGKAIPCTAENKSKIMNEHPLLMEFVTDKIDSITEFQAEKEDAEAKN